MLPVSNYRFLWTGTRIALVLTVLLIGPGSVVHALSPVLPIMLIGLAFIALSLFVTRAPATPPARPRRLTLDLELDDALLTSRADPRGL